MDISNKTRIYDDLFDRSTDTNTTIQKLTCHILANDIINIIKCNSISIYIYDDNTNIYKRIISSPYQIDIIRMSVFIENVIRSGSTLNINTDTCYLKDEINTICRQHQLSSVKGLLFYPIFMDNDKDTTTTSSSTTNKVIAIVEVIKQDDIFTNDDEKSLALLLSKASTYLTNIPAYTVATPLSSKRLSLRTVIETDEMDFYRNKNSTSPFRLSSLKSPMSSTAMHTYFNGKRSSLSNDNLYEDPSSLTSPDAIDITISTLSIDTDDNARINTIDSINNDTNHRINTIDSINTDVNQIELIDQSRLGGNTSLTDILHYIDITYDANPKNIKISKNIKILSLDIDNYDFDPFQYSLNELIIIAEITIGRYYLTEIFKINSIKLRNFIIAIAYLYVPDNHFHNFYHASQVLNNCYHILRNGADNYLTPLDVLLVFVSALCHDLDHPGNNNHFETKKNSWLSKRYSDDAILERHALTITLILLDDDETSIWKEISNDDRIILRHQLRTAIISTDMTHHKNIVEEMALIQYDVNDIESRHSLSIHILHCADLSAQTQLPHLAQKWSLLINEEFKNQAEKEISLNLELTDIMQGLNDDLKRSKLQVNFIGNVVLPLWSAFVNNFSSLTFAIERINNNLCYHAANVEKFTN